MRNTIAGLCLATLSATAVAADTYVIDDGHTFPTIEYNHLGLSNSSIRFDRTSGTITLDRAAQKGSADITIDATSVSGGLPKFDDHLKSADFFEVEKYPTITFKSDQFRFDGDRLDSVAGKLTVHGVTRPLTLKVTSFTCKEHPMKKVQACGANAMASFKRSDWGVGAYVPAVSDEVTLRLQVEAHKQ